MSDIDFKRDFIEDYQDDDFETTIGGGGGSINGTETERDTEDSSRFAQTRQRSKRIVLKRRLSQVDLNQENSTCCRKIYSKV